MILVQTAIDVELVLLLMNLAVAISTGVTTTPGCMRKEEEVKTSPLRDGTGDLKLAPGRV